MIAAALLALLLPVPAHLFQADLCAATPPVQAPAAARAEPDPASGFRALAAAEPELALRKAFLAGDNGATLFIGRTGHGLVAGGEARWVDALVDEIDALCIDIGFAAGEAVERWVHTGEGGLDALLDDCAPWSWDRAGAERVLRALRERCERTPDKKPRIYGVGIGNPKREFMRAQAFIEAADFDLGHRTGIVLGPLRQETDEGRSRWFVLDAAERYVVRVAIGEAYNVLVDQREKLVQQFGEREADQGLQSLLALSNVERSLSFVVEGGEMDPHGDMLATMVVWARSHHPASARFACLVPGRDTLRASDPHSAAACFERAAQTRPATLLVVAGKAVVQAADPNTASVRPRPLEIDAKDAKGPVLWAAAAKQERLYDLRGMQAAEAQPASLRQALFAPCEVQLGTRSMAAAQDALVDFVPAADLDFLHWVPELPRKP